MAELLPQERLQPSLLDRLTDDAPQTRVESREQRVLNLAQLRTSVLRDVAWLLNTTRAQASQDFSEVPAVVTSTLNYGIPDLAGVIVTGRDMRPLERAVREAVLNFEPRILHHTLKVTVHVDPERPNRKTLLLIIEGRLWAQPLPLNLYLQTELNLETGAVTVVESHG